MKYIVIELQTNADETVGNLVYAYDRKDEAVAKWHDVMAAANRSDLPAHAAVLLTSEGQPLRHDVHHAAQEPMPDEEI